MKRMLLISVIVGGFVSAWFVRDGRSSTATEPLAHFRSEFNFVVKAPMEVTAPLFGQDAERGWGGGAWNPQFFYPQPGRDVQGAVFAVRHGQHESIWVTTVFDIQGGHVQFVSVVSGATATTIDIHIAPHGKDNSTVNVAYERTALDPQANEHIQELAKADADSGPHWESAISDYLQHRSEH